MEGLLPIQLAEPETPSWAIRGKEESDALAGIADPLAFMAAVREVAKQYVRCARHTPFDLCHAIDELAAMLPPETAP